MVVNYLLWDFSLHLFRQQGVSLDLNSLAPQNTVLEDKLCKQAGNVKRNPEPAKYIEIQLLKPNIIRHVTAT